MVLKIKEAYITAMPKSFADPLPKVMVKLEGAQQFEELFEYYPDEINFLASEFVGLTLEEARTLKFKKDKQYLQS